MLDGGGAMFFRMLADRAAGLLPEAERRGLTDTAVAAAIWDLVWAGRLTNDTLAPLRTVLGSGAAGGGRQPWPRRARRAGRRGGPNGRARPDGVAGPGPVVPAGCRCPAASADRPRRPVRGAQAGIGPHGAWSAAPGRPR